MQNIIPMKRIITFIFLFATLNLSARYQTKNDIAYSQNTDGYSAERCRLDIHYNDSLTGLPVVIWFHGGGLTGGNRKIPKELQNSGYVVIAPNYRLLPNVEISDCIDDAAAAVAWAFRNVKNFGGDTSKIFVAGHSAGGYLTSMIGLERKWLAKYGIEADSIAALVPYSGQVITHFAHRKLKGVSEMQPMVDEYAPLFHIRKDAPPYIIITGDAEMELFGRYEENLYMWRMLNLIGHPDAQIFKLDGYNHGDMARPAHHILKQQIKRITTGKK